jgi:hypothetical protein
MWSGRRFVRPDLIYALRLLDTIFACRITSFPLSEERACNGIKGARFNPKAQLKSIRFSLDSHNQYMKLESQREPPLVWLHWC